jgi:hypothetical protein
MSLTHLLPDYEAPKKLSYWIWRRQFLGSQAFSPEKGERVGYPLRKVIALGDEADNQVASEAKS